MTDIAESFATGEWAFTTEVVDEFDEHVRASVPHYDLIQEMVAAVADWALPAHGTVADLGASTGTTTALLAARHPSRHIFASLYDLSDDMLDRARRKLEPYPNVTVRYSTAPIEAGPYIHVKADLTVSLFTLQFLPYDARVDTLRLARAHADAAGTLLVAEKVRPADSRWAEIANDLSHDWKAAHDLSDTAIRAKARALRGVLQPLPAEALTDAMVTAGWVGPEVIFRWHSWTLIGAHATKNGY